MLVYQRVPSIEPYIPISRCGACFRPSSPSVAISAISGTPVPPRPAAWRGRERCCCISLRWGAWSCPKASRDPQDVFFFQDFSDFLGASLFFCLNEFRRRYRGWYIMETIWNQGVLDEIRWSWWSISTATRLPFGHHGLMEIRCRWCFDWGLVVTTMVVCYIAI